MFKLFWELLLVYLLYKFIVGFVLPEYHTTKQVKRKAREFNRRFEQQSPTQPTPSSQEKPKRDHSDDYIEFEEIK